MANQIEVPKLLQTVLTGPDSDESSVPKLVMFVLAEPGDSGPDTSNKQGHVYSRIIRRD